MIKICMECGNSDGFHQPGCQWHRDDRINDSVCYNNMAKRIAELRLELDETREKLLGLCLDVYHGESRSAFRTAEEYLKYLDSFGGENK